LFQLTLVEIFLFKLMLIKIIFMILLIEFFLLNVNRNKDFLKWLWQINLG